MAYGWGSQWGKGGYDQWGKGSYDRWGKGSYSQWAGMPPYTGGTNFCGLRRYLSLFCKYRPLGHGLRHGSDGYGYAERPQG